MKIELKPSKRKDGKFSKSSLRKILSLRDDVFDSWIKNEIPEYSQKKAFTHKQATEILNIFIKKAEQ